MDNYFVDERTGLKYELVGDYYVIASGNPPDDTQQPIGLWGRRHLRYLKDYREGVLRDCFSAGGCGVILLKSISRRMIGFPY